MRPIFIFTCFLLIFLLFAQQQEAVRKDLERAFGLLQTRFAIIIKPSLAWDEERLSDIITSCIIMHTIVQDKRDRYTHSADGREFMGDRPQGQSKGTSGLNDEFEHYTDRIVDINRYLANKDDVKDRQTHLSLTDDLVENICLLNSPPNVLKSLKKEDNNNNATYKRSDFR
ncbi:uncharacterized protein LOC130798763 [Amaranthus tricolor]|uniref:uncharacterized protein LOC130798763 n=1 Tax=Amaranthus tricolor TaxID=29722 RepID=UPI00258FA12A|nr:uncharacterized protein LOC130798763 [Amaranthus tricolor]